MKDRGKAASSSDTGGREGSAGPAEASDAMAGEGVLEEAAAAVAQEEEEDDDEEDESEEEDSDDSESESDSSDNSDPEGQKLPSETLLQGRRSRATAGRRMAALLDDEEDDTTFYKEQYGEAVFHDSNSDFDLDEEESWDELDSDFDEDEVMEDQGSAAEPAEEELKRKRSVYTDPLKAPKKRRTGNAATGRRKGPPTAPGAKREQRLRVASSPQISRKSSRSSAVKKTEEALERKEKKEKKKPIHKAPRPPAKKLTQAERLREAVQTERDNAQSLMKFEQREAAKKKTALRKTTFGGPVIRYISQTELDQSTGTKQTRNLLQFISCDTFLGQPFHDDRALVGPAQIEPQVP